ncbi:hypothetical protein HALLA_15370 [Halostagnicola larsenii XH-48]|uniref:Uncharacterized protein n=1 Tax=Halostagnicola larsenii XH-48 TaxID=797299 RepID=W0JUP8_9EURY|nr:hypothetical protein [Halostagnicola larsenii]AHG01072.1 hypothetical protein HALLA_15370 [Halostagnicola larsenii XH-48]
MVENDSGTGAFVSAIHRSILGVLLAIAGLIGLSWAVGAIYGGSVLLGLGGIVIAVITFYWIFYLFVEGLRER